MQTLSISVHDKVRVRDVVHERPLLPMGQYFKPSFLESLPYGVEYAIIGIQPRAPSFPPSWTAFTGDRIAVAF